MVSQTAVGLTADQRRDRRRRVQIRCQVDDGRVVRFTHTIDLSTRGARVATAAPPPVGAAVDLSFELGPSVPAVRVRARVVWRAADAWGRGGVMGLAFTEGRAIAAVEAFVRGA